MSLSKAALPYDRTEHSSNNQLAAGLIPTSTLVSLVIPASFAQEASVGSCPEQTQRWVLTMACVLRCGEASRIDVPNKATELAAVTSAPYFALG